MRARPILLLFAAGVSATPASAQWRGSAIVGLGNAPSGEGVASQWSVAPSLSWAGSRTRFELTGEYRTLTGRGARSGGLATASWFVPVTGGFRMELTGSGRLLGGTGRSTLGAWDAGPRLHLLNPGHGIWIGTQAGRDSRGGTLRWEAAYWRQLGPLSIQFQGWQSAAVSRFQVANSQDTLSPPDSGTRSQVRVTTSVGSWVRWSRGRMQLAGALGVRHGGTQPGETPLGPSDGLPVTIRAPQRTGTRTWWQLEASYWVGSRIALTGAVGDQPGDPAVLAPAGRYLQFGFRMALAPRGPSAGSHPASRQLPTVETRRLSSASVELRIAAPGAGTVELMGDFTDWRPVRMEPTGGDRWLLRIAVPPGLYRFNVRYDGGPWQAPAGVRTETDEFGATTAVVVIS